MPEDGPPHRPHTLYGRRRGKKLRTGRQVLFERLLPELAIPTAQLARPVDPRTLFQPMVGTVWLEIGTGGGEHLVSLAERHPDIGFIGCEPFVAGLARLVARVHERGLGNVRVFGDDAAMVLEALPEASLGRAFLLFPDPWPKRRHASRRFVSAANIQSLARTLADGAEWRIATDDMGYCRWTLGLLSRAVAFRWLARDAGDWRRPPADWSATRYEQKAKAAGRSCVHLGFERQPRPP